MPGTTYYYEAGPPGASGPSGSAYVLPSPNQRPGLWKAFRYLTSGEVATHGGTGEAFEELRYNTCCVNTRVYVENYQPDPTAPVVRNQVLAAVYDATATPDHYVYVDGSFKPGQTVPAKFVPIDSTQALYGYVRRDTVPPSINDWRVGELSIWNVAGKDQFATLKVAGGPFAAFTGIETTTYKPAAPPTPASELYRRLSLTDAQGIEGNGVTGGVLYAVAADQTTRWNAVSRQPGSGTLETVLIGGAENYFDVEGTLLDANGVPLRRVNVNVGNGTYTRIGGVATSTSRVLRFDQDYEYAELTSGAFTTDLSGASVGACVGINLAAACSNPAASLATGFELLAGEFMPGNRHLYEFKVAASGVVQYYIVTRP